MAEWNAVLDFKRHEMTIDEQTIPMRQPQAFKSKTLLLNTYREATEPLATKEETERTTRILDAKYEPADLPKIVEENCPHLSSSEKEKLLQLLRRHESSFQGKLGKWVGEEVHFDLQEGVDPWQGRPYPVPRIHRETLKKEVERLVEIGVLEEISGEESKGWGSPSFIMPNPMVKYVS